VLVFPSEAEPAPESSTRFVLPSSGLAEDILRSVEPPGAALEAPEVAAAPVEPSAAAPAARSHSLAFFGAPLREEREAVEATEHLVTFLLADEEYGVDVRLVQEIIRVAAITPVPRAPEFIKGVINLRGRIIPVVDLKKKLGLGEVDEQSRRARVVVVRVRERLIGVLVDGASQVLKVPISVIEAAPEEVVSISQSFIRGVAKLEKRLIILIALQEILIPESREPVGAEAS
jgi:purine-binding chemotaxis protein CheW